MILIYVLSLTFTLISIKEATLTSGHFNDNITVYQCPDPNKNSTYLSYKSSLPLTVNTPTKVMWCTKQPSSCGGYEQSGHIIQTPYIQSLAGFKAEIEWNFSDANYTNQSRAREWTIFYNENDCYGGGVEFGVLYWHFHKKFRYYCSIDSNLNTQLWVDKPIDFNPVNGINHINMSLIRINQEFQLKFDYSIDNKKTFKSLNYKFPIERWMQEFRQGKGRITGKVNKKADTDSMDSVKFVSIDYFIDNDFLQK